MKTFSGEGYALDVYKEDGGLRMLLRLGDGSTPLFAVLLPDATKELIERGTVELQSSTYLRWSLSVISLELDTPKKKLIMVTSTVVKELRIKEEEWENLMTILKSNSISSST